MTTPDDGVYLIFGGTAETRMVHTTAQKVRMRLTAIVNRLTSKAISDERIVSDLAVARTTAETQRRIREEYRDAIRDEFPGCQVVFQWGRVKVFPPEGYMDQRGSVGCPISVALMGALFFGIAVRQ